MENTIPGLELIGKGYDIFGRFAHPSGVINANIFKSFENEETNYYTQKINGYAYQVPDFIPLVEEHTSDGFYVEGSNTTEFLQELDLKIKMDGKYSFYSAEVDFGFHQSKQVSNEYYYTLLSSIAKGYRIALPDNDTLKSKIGLTSAFEMSLNDNDNSPEAIDDLFNKYGTHFLGEAVLGGKNSYYATVEKSKIDESITVESTVKASYNNLFTSGSVSVNQEFYSDSSVSSTYSETGIETVGGNETLAVAMYQDNDAYYSWLDSILQEPALIDFTETSLRPIWELCDTKERSDALENRFYELAREKSTTLTRGTAQHGDSVYYPWGDKEDWNLFVTPATLGYSEGDPEKDRNNAILNFEYGIDEDHVYPDHWQIKATYRFRTNYNHEDSIDWHTDGMVNYVMIPKFIFDAGTGKKREVSRIEDIIAPMESPHQIDLKTPDGTDNWYYLIAPANFTYTEGKDSWDADNALIGWDWTFGQAKSIYPFYKYRKGSSADYITNVITRVKILWVHKDYAYWSGATGNQNLQLPPSEKDTNLDHWELIVSPTRIGDITGGDERKSRSLLNMQCLVSNEDHQWNVNTSFDWVEDEYDASTYQTSEGHVDCLFIRTSILDEPTHPDYE